MSQTAAPAAPSLPPPEESQEFLRQNLLAPYFFHFLEKEAGVRPQSEQQAALLFDLGQKQYAADLQKQAAQAGPVSPLDALIKSAAADLDSALGSPALADQQLYAAIGKEAAALAADPRLDPHLYSHLAALDAALQQR